MLNKSIFLAIIFAFSVISGAAQSNGDYNKFEVFAGYTNNQSEDGNGRLNSSGTFVRDRNAYNGFEASGVGNISRYFGIKGDFSAAFRNRDYSKRSIDNFLGGVQLKDNAADGTRFRPFAHALIGAARTKITTDILNAPFCTQSGVTCANFSRTKSGIASAFGGGLDIKATRRLSIRVIQFDYNPIHPDSGTQNNFGFGFGLVFH